MGAGGGHRRRAPFGMSVQKGKLVPQFKRDASDAQALCFVGVPVQTWVVWEQPLEVVPRPSGSPGHFLPCEPAL